MKTKDRDKVEAKIATIRAQLRRCGMKVTSMRVNITYLFTMHPGKTLTVKTIQGFTGACYPSLYRNLEQLADAGILDRVPVTNGGRSYTLAGVVRASEGRTIARAWKEWEQSEAGQKHLDAASLRVPPSHAVYLRNRIWRAFVAGANMYKAVSK